LAEPEAVAAAMAVGQAAMALVVVLLLLPWQQSLEMFYVCLSVEVAVVEQELQEVVVAELQVLATLAEKYLTLEI
jgi:hypothetical protein